MSDFRYNLAVRDGEPESILIFGDNKQSIVATPDNPGFHDAVRMVVEEGTTFQELQVKLSVAIAVDVEFKRLSERVTVRGGHIYFDGDRVNNALSKAIADFFVSGAQDYMALVHFMEKVNQNPQTHSREQLYEWMVRYNFGIAPDGDIIAYKGVNVRFMENSEEFVSSNAGKAVVNGKPFEGVIPNILGAIVEMPRSEVNHDPRQGCSTGLHVSNWRYASTFATRTLRVKVNPRDVCSVPTESDWEKVRVCRYQVLGIATAGDDMTTTLYVPEVYKTLCMNALPGGTGSEVTPEEEHPGPRGAEKMRKPRTRKTPAKVTAKAQVTKRTSKKEQPAKPLFYEDMNKAQLREVPFNQLRWVSKEWDIKTLSSRPNKEELVEKISRAAAGRRRKFKGIKNPTKSYTPTTR
jgi:hypothetical protein